MRRPPFRWRTSIWTKAGLAAALVAAFDVLLYDHDVGANLALAGLAALSAAVMAHPEARRDRRAVAALALAAGFCLLLLDRPGLIAWTMFAVTLGVAVLSPRAGRSNDVFEWAQRFLRAGLLAAPAPVFDARRLLARGGQAGAARRVALGAVLPVAGGAMFLSLFVMANPLIESALAGWRLPPFSPGRGLFWGFVAAIAWALLRPRGLRRPLALPSQPTARGAASASVVVSLVVFNALFALQNGLDLAFLWSGAPLPQGVTFAQYAHRGAYLLIVTALLAGAFVLVFLRPGAADSRAVRWLVIAWVAQNLMLAASSALRTITYVEVYGLTQLRISALAWMGLVGIGLVLICVRLVRGKSASWLVGSNAFAMALVLTAVAATDIGAVAATWNVRHARELTGEGASLDLCYLAELGPAALLPLVELEQRPLPEKLAAHVAGVRTGVMERLVQRQSDWRIWTWRGQRRLAEAERRLGARPWSPVTPGARNCEWDAVPPSATLTPPAQAGS